MKNFFVITNDLRDPGFEFTNTVCEHICSLGGKITGKANSLPRDSKELVSMLSDKITSDTECILTLGGDGTLLRSARSLYKLGIPFLGFNIGHLGYLTEGNRDNELECIKQLINDDFHIEERMLVSGEVCAKGELKEPIIALNDITLNRNNYLKTIKFNLNVNGQPLYKYEADGIIVSTPTGSTAYNLSCGGPIAMPTAKLIIVTPIASHSLNDRTLVLDTNSTIEIEVVGWEDKPDNDVDYVSYFDGDEEIHIKAGDKIIIKTIDESVKFVNLSSKSFLETLKNKMS